MARSTRTKRSTTKPLGKNFADHQAVNHGDGEYARGATTTNTVEGFFGIFKGGMVGVYQHGGEKSRCDGN